MTNSMILQEVKKLDEIYSKIVLDLNAKIDQLEIANLKLRKQIFHIAKRVKNQSRKCNRIHRSFMY